MELEDKVWIANFNVRRTVQIYELKYTSEQDLVMSQWGGKINIFQTE